MELMEFPSLLLLPSILLIFLISALFFSQNRKTPPSSNSPDSFPPILKTYPIIGNLPQLMKNGHRMLEWSAELLALSPTGSVTITPVVVFTVNPLNIEHISKSNFGNYPKGRLVTTALHDFLGNGIFNINGEQWKVQRKTASYEFNTKSLRSFVLDRVGYEIDNRLVPFLRDCIRRDAVVDLQDVLERFAFDNICNLLFLEDPDCLYGRSERGEKFYRAFDEAAHLSVHRAMVPFALIWKIKKLLGMESERRLRNSLATVHEFVEGFIRSRREGEGEGKDKSDFLSRFMEEGNHSDEFIRDILISFMLAGRDTAPSALTWFFWLVSSRPDVAEKIREELRSIRASRNIAETFTLDELREMNYLHAAISESMRLYPPVSLLLRECARDDVLPDGTKVKKGWSVMYSNYAMGRTERIWGEDWRDFRPERWLEDGVFKPKNLYEYPVFHVGPRLCLGKDMAYIQMKALVASILEGFCWFLETFLFTSTFSLDIKTKNYNGLI